MYWEKSEPRCNARLREVLHDSSQYPSLAFMHMTKAGGSTVEWVIKREQLIRNFSSDSLFCKETSFARLVKNRTGIHFSTMLRRPVSRFVSFMNFRRYDSRKKMRHLGTNYKYALSRYSNIYARFLLDITSGNKDAPLYKKRIVARCIEAHKKLRKNFALVGTSERFLESIAVIAYVFRFEDFPVYGIINKQIGSPGISSIDKKALKTIRDENKCDESLYRTANLMLDESISCLGQPFQKYLQKFRRVQKEFSQNNPFCIEECVEYGKPHLHGLQLVDGEAINLHNTVNESNPKRNFGLEGEFVLFK